MNNGLEAFILKLLQNRTVITVAEIIQEAGTSPNKRTIQRTLNRLLKQNLIEPKGQARARRYKLKPQESNKTSVKIKQETAAYTATYDDIQLSETAKNLLQYLEQPLIMRPPVSYNHDFLSSYDQDTKPYLNDDERSALRLLGHSDNQIHPAGTYARKILNRILIDLSWNSSRLEGNTYSLLETKRLIEFGENAEGKDVIESQMILNHKNAIEYIVESTDEEISCFKIWSIHALLSYNLLENISATGKIREIAVGISGTSYIPLDDSHRLKETLELFITKMNSISDPFEQSLFALIHLSYLQAFEDVNKRTARLAANIPLIKHNLKPLSFIGVDLKIYITALLGVYEKNDISLIKDLFLWAYKQSAQRYSGVQQTTMGLSNFLKLKYRDSIQEIVRTIILENIDIAKAVDLIRSQLKKLNLSETERTQLFEVIETELLSLHVGNIAIYKIQPREFERWQKGKLLK